MPKSGRIAIRAGARAYLPALAAPWCAPAGRFVVATVGRAGSELLTQRLNSHPEIVCDGEVLFGHPRFPRLLVSARATRAGRAGARVYGWKLLASQLRAAPRLRPAEGYLAELSESGCRVILLERRNHLQQAISLYRGFMTGFHDHGDAAAPFRPLAIDPEFLIAATGVLAEESAWLRSAVDELPHLALVYEDDLLAAEAQESTVARVCGYLGLTVRPTSTDLVKVAPTRTSQLVSNWVEVAEAVRASAFAHFLDHEPPSAAPRPA